MTSAVADAQCTLIIWACAAKGEGGRKEEEGGVRREVKCKCVLCLVVFAHVDLPPGSLQTLPSLPGSLWLPKNSSKKI